MTDNPFEVPPQAREQAEKNIALARQFYDQWMGGITHAISMWSAATGGQSTPQCDTLREQAVRFSKQNAEAAFALAEKLARANDLQQLMTLQTQFIQEQLRSYSVQAQELGGLASGAMTASGSSEEKTKASTSGPPPSGTAAPPGVKAPDERAPGTRKKGSPEHDLGPVSKPTKA